MPYKRYRYVITAAHYDALNRLKGADFSPWSGSGWTSTAAYDLTSIAYDAAGNLTKLRRYRAAGTLVDQLAYAYPAGANRLSSVTEAVAPSAEAWDAESGALTHDANGNVVTAPGPYAITAATHDAWNRPLTVTRAGTTTQYRYTAGGARLGKQVAGGALEFYVTDGPTTLAVVTVPAGGGAPSAWHFNLLAGDAVIGRQPHSGARRHYHADLVRSVRAVTAGASVLESRDYDPWGVELAGRTLGSGTKEGFTGQERDAERGGVDAFWARGYLPALGRWAGPDPLRDSFPAWSAFVYVLANPLLYHDPFGLSPDLWIQIAAAAVRIFEPYSTYTGKNEVDFSKMSFELFSALTRAGLQNRVKLGVYQATEGIHADPRHSGCSSRTGTCDWPRLAGHAADVNEVWTVNGRVEIGEWGVISPAPTIMLANSISASLLGDPQVRAVIWPTGYVVSGARGGLRVPRSFPPGSDLWAAHQSHIHVSAYTRLGR